MKVHKNGHVFDVSGVQLRAFLSSGYELVKEPKDEKAKGKGAKKSEEPKDEKK